jgi:hypothetical protein
METIPKIFDNRVHNLEFYAQKRIYQSIKLLNKLPMSQNVSGEFTNYIGSKPEDLVGDVISTGDGLDFNEIKFGDASTVRGATVPKGYMFKLNTRLEEIGRLDAQLQVFMNKAVATLAHTFDKVYFEALKTGAGVTSISDLNTIDSDSTGIDVIENELKMIDAIEVQSDVETGFTPTTVFAPRADVQAIKIALAKSNLLDDSNFEYIGVPTSILSSGHKIIMDLNNPTCTIEKYADPNYSVVAALENEPELNSDVAMDLPQSFINIKMTEPDEPQRSYVYVWAESGLNILEPSGIAYI